MSSILEKWINEEVCLSRQVTSFEEDFRNGYLLAEILWRCNQQPDFELCFQDSTDSNAIVNNFCRIEPTLRGLNVRKFNSRVAQLVINGNRDVTIELLYNIHMALWKASGRGGRNKQMSASTGGILPIRMTRPRFDNATSLHFQKALHSMAENQSAINIARHLRKFDLQGEQLQQNALELEATERDALDAYVAEVRRQRIQRTRAEHDYVQEWQEKGIGIWLENQRIQKGRELLKKNFHSVVESRKQQQREKERQLATMELRSGMKGMKNKLLSLGIRTEATTTSPDSDFDDEALEDDDGLLDERVVNAPIINVSRGKSFREILCTPNSNTTAGEDKLLQEGDHELNHPNAEEDYYNALLAQGDESIPTAHQPKTAEVDTSPRHPTVVAENKTEFEALLRELKSRHSTQKVHAVQRDSRRRSFVSKQQERAREHQERVVNELRSTCNREKHAMGEQQLCELVEQQLVYVDVIQSNRALRQQEYNKESEKESEVRVQRDKAAFNKLVATHQKQVDAQLEQIRVLREASTLKESYDSYLECRDVVCAAIELSMMKHDLDTRYGGPCDHQAWSDIRAKFSFPSEKYADIEFLSYIENRGRWELPNHVKVVLPSSLAPDTETSEEQELVPPTAHETKEKKSKKKQSEANISQKDDELQHESPQVVDLSREEVIDKSSGTVSGDLLMDLVASLEPPQQIKEKPDTPEFLVTAAIIGPPCCGKSALAHALAKQHCLIVVDPIQLVQHAHTQRGGEDSLYSNSATVVRDALSHGQHITDEMYVGLILDELKHLKQVQQQQIARNNDNIQHIQQLQEEFETKIHNGDNSVRRHVVEILFQQWDRDSQGYISVDNLTVAARNVLYSSEQIGNRDSTQPPSNHDYASEASTLLYHLDANLDNQVTVEELWTYLHAEFSSLSDRSFCEFVFEIMKLSTVEKPVQGWVLDGFPWSLTQADLLEQALSGTEAFEQPRQLTPLSCIPYSPPSPLDPSRLLGKSYFDCVFSIQASDRFVTHRALGQRVYPTQSAHSSSTIQEQVHVVLAPPKVGDPTRESIVPLLRVPTETKLRESFLAPRLYDYRKQESDLHNFFDNMGNLSKVAPVEVDELNNHEIVTKNTDSATMLFKVDIPVLDEAIQAIQEIVTDKLADQHNRAREEECKRRERTIASLPKDWLTDSLRTLNEEDRVDVADSSKNPDSIELAAGSESTQTDNLTNPEDESELQAPFPVERIPPLNKTTMALCWPSAADAFEALEFNSNVSEPTLQLFEALCYSYCNLDEIKDSEFDEYITQVRTDIAEFRNSSFGKLSVVVRTWFLTLKKMKATDEDIQNIDEMMLELESKSHVIHINRDRTQPGIEEFKLLLQNCLISHGKMSEEEEPQVVLEEYQQIIENLQLDSERVLELEQCVEELLKLNNMEDENSGIAVQESDDTSDTEANQVSEMILLAQLANTASNLSQDAMRIFVLLLEQAILISTNKLEAEQAANNKKKKKKPSSDPTPSSKLESSEEDEKPPKPYLWKNQSLVETLTRFTFAADAGLHKCLLSMFQQLRQRREEQATYLLNLRENFDRFLTGGDEKQGIVEPFQLGFNGIPQDMRYDVRTKHELHLRTDLFRQEIWSLIEHKYSNGKTELEQVENDGWVKWYKSQVIAELIRLIQHEAHFYHSVRSTLVAANKADARERIPISEISDVLSLGTESVLPKEYIEPVAVDEMFGGDAQPGKSAGKKDTGKGKGSKGPGVQSDEHDESSLHVPGRLVRAQERAAQLVKSFQTVDDYPSMELIEQDVRFMKNIGTIVFVGQQLLVEVSDRFSQHLEMLQRKLDERVWEEFTKCELLVMYIRRCIEESSPLIDDICLSGVELIISKGISKPAKYSVEELRISLENQEADQDEK